MLGRCELYGHSQIIIGDSTIIGDGVYVSTSGHDIDDPEFPLTTAPIHIGSHVWICTGAVVLKGVAIGDGAVIGAHAVVTKEVPPLSVVAGNPARVLRQRRGIPSQFDPLSLSSIDYGASILRLKAFLAAATRA